MIIVFVVLFELLLFKGGYMRILFVNACVRIDSRTNRIAAQVLETLDGDIKEVKLSDIRFTDTSEDFLRKQ